MDPVAEFIDAIAAAGLTVPENVVADGALHRFASNGKRHDDSGWYVLHLDGLPAGSFGDWRSGLSETWRADVKRELTADEKREYRERMQAQRRAREAEERRRHESAEAKAAEIWSKATAATEHPYLTTKGIQAHGVRVDSGRLVIPMRDTTVKFASLQFIDADGGKKFLTGGRVSGCYFGIGKPDTVLCIAEGFATAASIHEATGHAVAVAFNAGNLLPVAKSLRAKLPGIKIIVCADDDARTEGNPGMTKAIEAARAVNAAVAVPDFGDFDGTDFNDLHKLRGAGAVREGINGAKRVKRTSQLAALADIQPSEIEWLWPGRIAIGKLSMLAGDPGLGKSILSLAIATHVTLGSRWPVDGGKAPEGDVVLLSAEDDAADTIRPRLDAAGANVRRVFALSMVRITGDDGKPGERMFSLERDIELLDAEIANLPACRLVVIDPISAYLGATDSHKNSDVRGLLAPLAEMAARRRVAVLGVTHLNKGGGKAIYRTMGSLAFVAAARAVFGVVKDEDNPSRRLLLPVKNNLGPDADGLAYDIQTVGNVPVLRWESDPVKVSMDDALYRDDDKSELDDAADWLRAVLDNGRVRTTELQKLAKQAGHSWRTVRRAKDRIRAKSEREGYGSEGRFYWMLPIDGQPYTHSLATYDETRAASSFETPEKSPDSHRCPTLDGYGDGHLCSDPPDTGKEEIEL